MTTYDFVHLVLLAANGRIQGRTKLQKVVYFVGVLTGHLDKLGYRPHYYGPYSSSVADAVDDLRALNFLQQKTTALGIPSSRGFESVRYDYSLTDDGKQIAEEKSHEFPDEWEMIESAMETLNDADASDYVKLSIAAKAYFMHGKSSRPTTPDELSKMAQRFGWKVSEQQLQEADEWLESLGLVETAAAT